MTLCVTVHHKIPGRLKPGERRSSANVKQRKSPDELAALPKLLTNKRARYKDARFVEGGKKKKKHCWEVCFSLQVKISRGVPGPEAVPAVSPQDPAWCPW